MSRRSAERDAAPRAARSESAAASPFRAPPARSAAVPSHAATPAPTAPESRPTTRPGAEPAGRRRSRSATATRGAAESGIPLMAPPPWQVEETAAEERQQAREQAREQAVAQRGLPSWLGLVVLLVVTGIGGLIDAIAGSGIKGTFAIGLIVGSLAAILLVRRSSMFPIVVAPPLVYFLASAVLLYVRSGGLSNRAAITDAAASWLVYGFPAIAGATAVVLIVAGVRMILHR